MRSQPAKGDIVLPGIAIHVLEGLAEDVSATEIRAAAGKGKPLEKLVGPVVAEYIRKQRLYQGEPAGRQAPVRIKRHGKAACHLQLLPGGKSESGPK